MKKFSIIFNLILAYVILCSNSFADLPRLISYQGKLTEDNGTPVSDGKYDMVFRLYTDPLGGSPIWEESHTISDTYKVEVKVGVFSVILGEINPIPIAILDNQLLYLGISVSNGDELIPRAKIIPSLFSCFSEKSLYSSNSEMLSGYLLSTTVLPNMILPLDGNGKYPNSVLYTGTGNGLDADTVDGMHKSDFELMVSTQKPPRTVTVGATKCDFTSITAALNSITDASGSNWYIIKVSPGSYNESITLKSYIKVQGSGVDISNITSSNNVTVTGANNSIIDGFTIKNTNTTSAKLIYCSTGTVTISNCKLYRISRVGESYGFYCETGSLPTLKDCTIYISDSSENCIAVAINSNSIATITSCNFQISNTVNKDMRCVNVDTSKLYMKDCTLTVTSEGNNYTYGVVVWGTDGYAEIANSSITATGKGPVYGVRLGYTTKFIIETSHINVTSISSAKGIHGELTNLRVTNCEMNVKCEGTYTSATGIFCISSSTFDLRNTRIETYGTGSDSIAVDCEQCSASSIFNCILIGNSGGASRSYGLYVHRCDPLNVNNTMLQGEYVAAGLGDLISPPKFGNCQFIPYEGVLSTKPCKLVNCYNADYNPIANK